MICSLFARLESAMMAHLAVVVAASAYGQDRAELQVGHWVEVRGALTGADTFLAEKVELVAPDDEEELIGAVNRVAEDGTWFEVLGQRVRFDDETAWEGTSLEALVGARVEVQGEYKTPKKFSAEKVRPRDPGRDRILGRIDDVRRGADGALELDVMRFRVVVPAAAEYEREGELLPERIGPKRGPARSELAALGFDGREERDDDDDIPESLRLSDVLTLGVRFEGRRTDERELDLDPTDDEDRVDHTLSVRSELYWKPNPDLRGLLGLTNELRFRDDDEDGAFSSHATRLNEAYLRWYDIHGSNFGLQFGRQDFDERREWLWDENLDAVRLHWRARGLRLEVAGATVAFDGDDADEATETLLAYVTNDDDDRVVGAYVIDKRTELGGDDDRPVFYGLRAYGEWFDQHDVWAELAFQDGYRGTTDLGGYALDVGTTWTPESLAPWYLVGGFAFGAGDSNPDDGRDGNFRQTGFNDNNDKFGGVTSFRYYGEVFDPDLTNLSILTLGVGRRFGDDVSVDLVYHRYMQDEALARLGESELDATPNGVDRELGDGLDLVVGSRDHGGVDLELVLGAFWPGDAFEDDEMAWLAQVQVRFDL